MWISRSIGRVSLGWIWSSGAHLARAWLKSRQANLCVGLCVAVKVVGGRAELTERGRNSLDRGAVQVDRDRPVVVNEEPRGAVVARIPVPDHDAGTLDPRLRLLVVRHETSVAARYVFVVVCLGVSAGRRRVATRRAWQRARVDRAVAGILRVELRRIDDIVVIREYSREFGVDRACADQALDGEDLAPEGDADAHRRDSDDE